MHGKEQVLLLPAPMPIVEAVHTLSKALGFKLTIVAETNGEKEKCVAQFHLTRDAVLLAKDLGAVGGMASQGSRNSPFVVIAQEFSSLSQEVWRFMPPMGQFVLSDAVPDRTPDVLPFTRGASLHTTGIITLYRRNKPALGEVLKLSLDIIDQHRDVVVHKYATIDVGALKDAETKSLACQESAVLTYSYGRSSVKVSTYHQYRHSILIIHSASTVSQEDSILSRRNIPACRLSRRAWT